MVRLIGIAGKAGSGKDTVADFLVEKHGFERIAFADPIRDGLVASLDLPQRLFTDPAHKEVVIEHLGKSPRQLMQLFGTEFGRDLIHRDVWADIARARIRAVLEDGGQVVVSDVRFLNEVHVIEELGGTTLYLVRPGAREVSYHVSEHALFEGDCPRVVCNDGTINNLYRKITSIIARS